MIEKGLSDAGIDIYNLRHEVSNGGIYVYWNTGGRGFSSSFLSSMDKEALLLHVKNSIKNHIAFHTKMTMGSLGPQRADESL